MNSPTAPRPPVPPLATSSYGGDEVGLICGYLFDPEAAQQIRALGSDEAAAWLAEVAQPGAAVPPRRRAAAICGCISI